MLASPIEVLVPNIDGVSLGVVVEGSNNAVHDLEEDGVAMRAGLRIGDLILELDGTLITECDKQPGPVDGTLLVTSEPQSIHGAHAALDPLANPHRFMVLRLTDPESITASPPVSAAAAQQYEPPRQPSAPPPQPATSAAQPQPYDWETQIAVPDAAGQPVVKNKYNISYNLNSGTPMPTMHAAPYGMPTMRGQPQAAQRAVINGEMQQHGWATQIVVPDASFGAAQTLKNKYNLPTDAALPPTAQLAATHDEIRTRKMMFAAAGK